MSVKEKYFSAKRITGLAVLLALVVVLQAALGTISIGAVQLNFSLIPIVLGAVLYGAVAGGLLGFACGVVVLVQVINGAGFYSVIWTNSPVVTTLTCLLKTTVAGFVAGLLFKVIARKNVTCALFVASATVPVINTALFIVGCLCMNKSIAAFQAAIPDAAGMNMLVFILVVLVTFNFFVELAVNLVATPRFAQGNPRCGKTIPRKQQKMIICIDVGNTNVKYAIYDKDDLKISFRVSTDLKKTSDEYGSQLVNMLKTMRLQRGEITGGILSSVVPSLDYTIDRMCDLYLGFKPLRVGPGLKSGLNIRCDDAREVGADRIVNCVSALHTYGGENPLIVVDFGTATTFNIISEKGEFIGGVIAPGIKGSLDSLVNGTAKLPRVEIEAPESIIAKNTVTNMQAGIVFGFAGLVDYIVARIKRELGRADTKTVATGGFSEIISKEVSCIDAVDKLLTLNGLKYLYYLNRPENRA